MLLWAGSLKRREEEEEEGGSLAETGWKSTQKALGVCATGMREEGVGFVPASKRIVRTMKQQL